jgi:cholesterol transport system auxiliary component
MLLFLLSGCSLSGGMPGASKTAARQAYLLQGDGISAAVDVAAARQCLSLRVSATASAPGYGTTRMAYTTQPPRLDYFAYHEWADLPARMFAAMIETRLDASSLLGTVVTGSSDVRTDLRLDSELKSLRQDFTGDHSTLALAIKVSLVDVSRRSLLHTKTFSYTEVSDGSGPEAGASAANRAADRFLAELTVFVADSITGFDCPDGS